MGSNRGVDTHPGRACHFRVGLPPARDRAAAVRTAAMRFTECGSPSRRTTFQPAHVEPGSLARDRVRVGNTLAAGWQFLGDDMVEQKPSATHWHSASGSRARRRPFDGVPCPPCPARPIRRSAPYTVLAVRRFDPHPVAIPEACRSQPRRALTKQVVVRVDLAAARHSGMSQEVASPSAAGHHIQAIFLGVVACASRVEIERQRIEIGLDALLQVRGGCFVMPLPCAARRNFCSTSGRHGTLRIGSGVARHAARCAIQVTLVPVAHVLVGRGSVVEPAVVLAYISPLPRFGSPRRTSRPPLPPASRRADTGAGLGRNS